MLLVKLIHGQFFGMQQYIKEIMLQSIKELCEKHWHGWSVCTVLIGILMKIHFI